jgi:hypothetical protein
MSQKSGDLEPTCRRSLRRTSSWLLKVKLTVLTCREGPEGGYRLNCVLYLTSALDVGGRSSPRPGRFTPWKETRYPLYKSVAGCGRVRKISPPLGFDPRTVQPVAGRYTDCAIPGQPGLLIGMYKVLHKPEFVRYSRHNAPFWRQM